MVPRLFTTKEAKDCLKSLAKKGENIHKNDSILTLLLLFLFISPAEVKALTASDRIPLKRHLILDHDDWDIFDSQNLAVYAKKIWH